MVYFYAAQRKQGTQEPVLLHLADAEFWSFDLSIAP